MNFEEVIQELEPLATTKAKKSYRSEGAEEPLFGLSIKSMKPTAKKLMKQDDCQEIAYELYETGNYDLMYLAGMIVNPLEMSSEKFNEWLDKAYFYMISDYIVAVSLSETEIAFELADQWIDSGDDLRMSAGYATYSWLLGSRPDDYFDKERINTLLNEVKTTIDKAPNRTKYSMQYFVNIVGFSFIPLHKAALEVAKVIGDVSISRADGKIKVHNPEIAIMKQVERKKIGFKRKNVRC